MAVETKVGVYLCSGCGIGDSINLEELSNVATNEYKTPVCKSYTWLCKNETVSEIESDIKNESLNRVVIAACSDRFMEDVFNFDKDVQTVRVNLRENVAWTHKSMDEDTEMLAQDYLRMGITKAKSIDITVPAIEDITETILVVGGGLSGMSSALAASKAGSKVILTEKEDELGGWLKNLYKLPPTKYPYDTLEENNVKELIAEVEAKENTRVIKNCEIEKVSGQPGQFEVKYKMKGNSSEEILKIGSIVQATGWKEYDPENLADLGYGKFKNVITGNQLEKYIQNVNGSKTLNDMPVSSIAFIQCAGSRDEKHLPYCSAACCTASMKQMLYVREKFPDALIYMIYKDIRTPSQYELLYKRVQNEDRIFMTKGEVNNLRQDENGMIEIDVDNTLLGEEIQIKSDIVVLATGMVPSTFVEEVESDAVVDEDDGSGETLDGKKEAESAEIGAKILNLSYRQGTDLPTLHYGFPDSHYICFPYETRRTGIYAAGTVRAPMDYTQCISDAKGAALKSIQVLYALKNGVAVHPRSGDTTMPDFFMQRCTQCKRCTEECPFGTLDEDEKGTPLPNINRCRRCGICLGSCPERIITFKDYSIQSVSSMIKAVEIPDEFEEKPRILAFLCENDAYPALDLVGRYRMQFDPSVRVIPVRCLGAVNVVWIADALSRGFDGIIMLGCKHGDDYQCHYVRGSELAEKRMENVQEKLKQLVLEPERVQIHTVAIDEYEKLPTLFNDFVEEITEIGFNPYKGM